jgi:hypothetical protein
VPHDVRSPLVDIGTPFICGASGDMVVVLDDEEDEEELEATDEEEFARCALFRGMNIRATSSAFIAVRPP